MTPTRHAAAAALFAAALAAGSAVSSNVFAAAPPPVAAPADAAPSGADAAQAGAHERGPGPGGVAPHGFGRPGPGAPGPGMPFAHLRGLGLSEAQEDKVFAIMHAQAPQRREQDKAVRKAARALRELGRAERFDDARAVALSRELGQAVAAEALLRARTEAQVLAVLTPEQRERLRQRHARGPGRDGDGGAHAGRGADRPD